MYLNVPAVPCVIVAPLCTTLGTSVIVSFTKPIVFVTPAVECNKLASLYPALIPLVALCHLASNTFANPVGYVLELISSCASPSFTTIKSV